MEPRRILTLPGAFVALEVFLRIGYYFVAMQEDDRYLGIVTGIPDLITVVFDLDKLTGEVV